MAFCKLFLAARTQFACAGFVDCHRGRIICHLAIRNDSSAILSGPLRFSEIARVLVRFDHVAGGIEHQ
jgi:hypothetical protein